MTFGSTKKFRYIEMMFFFYNFSSSRQFLKSQSVSQVSQSQSQKNFQKSLLGTDFKRANTKNNVSRFSILKDELNDQNAVSLDSRVRRRRRRRKRRCATNTTSARRKDDDEATKEEEEEVPREC